MSATVDHTWPAVESATSSAITCHVEPLDMTWHNHLSRRYWDWRELYAHARVAAPMQHPDHVLGEVRFAPHQHLQPVVIFAERDGQCVAAGPLIPKVFQSKRVGSIGVNQRVFGLRLAGNDFLAAEPDFEVTAALYRAALAHVAKVGAGYLLIEDLDSQTALAEAVARKTPQNWAAFRHAGIQPRRRIQFPGSSEEYWKQFSTKTRSNFRRKLKKFGETRLERITDVADVPRFLETAHTISLQTWQTRQFGLRVRNNAEELDLLSTLAREGLLRCYLWFANGEPVAFTIGNQDKGCFHYEEVGYATPYAKYSPGQMMLIQMIDDLLSTNRPEWFDFGGGDADYKQLFANHESRSGTVWLWPPTLANYATVNYIRGCRSVRHGIRKAVVSFGMANRARQWVRYGWNRLTNAPSPTAAAATPNDSE